MSKHTPGPWTIFERKSRLVPEFLERLEIWSADRDVATISVPHLPTNEDYSTPLANAERIVACVNACEGIEDPSVIPELIKWARGFDASDFGEEACQKWEQLLARVE